MRQRKCLAEQIDLRGALAEAAKSAAATAIRESHWIKKIGTGVLQGVAADALVSACGVIASSLIRALMMQKVALDRRLDVLIRGPLETGMRAATEALELAASTREQVDFRSRRLEIALLHLETAWTNSSASETRDQDRFLIDVMRGLCASEMQGGGPLARKLLEDCARRLDDQADALAKDKAGLDPERHEKAAATWNELATKHGITMMAYAFTQALEASKSATDERLRLQKLSTEIGFRCDLAAILRSRGQAAM